MDINLTAFEPRHLSLLQHWLSSAHVRPWYPDPTRDLTIATAQPEGGFHCIISLGDQPVGYMRWQYVDRQTLDELGLQQIPENSVDIDILIGEPAHIAQGVGPRALELLAAKLRADPAVPMIGLTTSVHNFKAQRAFAKAGFSILLQYDPTGHGLCHLMLRDLRKERG